jgi:hypothetical protein
MPHPLVLQLRFTRKEFQRALKGVSAEDGERRLEPMNTISWMIGHLAWQEQTYWLTQPQKLTPAPEVNACANGQPFCIPSYDEMWAGWITVTKTADKWLDTLDSDMLLTHTISPYPPYEPYKESIGTRLRRTTYHYWYHIGEALAIRQLLGHTGLPQFVGGIGSKAPYIKEE